jgi:hypothetical protein
MAKHRFEFSAKKVSHTNPQPPELILTGRFKKCAEVACRQHSCKSVQIVSSEQTTILGGFLPRLERGLAVI